jgi:hypothetical protein
MHPDLIAAVGVLWIVGGHFNRATVGKKPKVVRGLFMRETHHVVAAFVHRAVMVILSQYYRARQK